MQYNRSELREKIMTILYQIELYKKNNIKYTFEDIVNEQLDIENEFVDQICRGVLDNKNTINEMANKYLNNWNIDRLGLTDQSILRMAIYEILWTDTPDLVCINEAIELAKRFSDDKVVTMINGVLDKIYHDKVNNE